MSASVLATSSVTCGSGQLESYMATLTTTHIHLNIFNNSVYFPSFFVVCSYLSVKEKRKNSAK